jgi:hypothetical protein
MKTTPLHRLLTVGLMLTSLLVMQLAVAAYACPGQPGAVVRVVMADMPDCPGMDVEQPTLCHIASHGDTERPSPAGAQVPDVPPFMPLALVAVLAPLERGQQANAVLAPIALLRHPSAPPIAIRHCCFRI